jgi:hypothetical protein
MTRANPHSPQAILEMVHKIDKFLIFFLKKKLLFEGECSNMVMDLHVKRRLLSIHV